ncbi:hypothetical protein DLAC_00499 [Tieghemostelium lacteum]|uniref:THH1/TOM1/TOM3 domain-containing protein n=1 Tax=Tieghemostelium lacteum TaxID=361077 RepID=A0A152A9V9_TIELA|nr:hypothetical protein DLAC_00499 [Tieghemostelium lacteum]|eukprot:KYR03012.1 hypothetical protein DLAC_00499 [Tieghemostelium lacteum]
MSTVFRIIEIIAIILYAILAVVCLLSLYKTFYRNEAKILSRIFHICICGFVSIREIWYIMRVVTGEGPITFTLNNTSFLFYLSGLLVVLFYWIETYNRTYVSTNEFLPKMKLIFIIINGLIYGVQIVFFVLFFTVNNEKREGSPVYLTIVLYQNFLSLIIGLVFLMQVIRMYFNFTQLDKDIRSSQMQQVTKICFLALIFAGCFVIRTIVFLYQPITGRYMNNEVFVTLGYFIPDIIPTLVQIRIIHTTMKSEIEDTSFIDNLYENELEDQQSNDGPIDITQYYQSNYINLGNGSDTEDDNNSSKSNNNNNNNRYNTSYDNMVQFKSDSISDRLKDISTNESLPLIYNNL